MTRTKDTGAVVLVKIDGVEYPLDITNLNGREVGVLKRVGHIRGISDLPDALIGGDLEVVAALAGIAMQRKGIAADYDKLLELSVGEIELAEPEADAVPTKGARTTPAKTGTPPSPDSTG